uniref:ABC_trans_aux domain-containing protein n=1 Tax=Macrostomum lignano TaxID=282301 RepID=A0A1I8FG99_9PLAT
FLSAQPVFANEAETRIQMHRKTTARGLAQLAPSLFFSTSADSRLIYRLIEYNLQVVGDVEAMVVSVLQPDPEREDFPASNHRYGGRTIRCWTRSRTWSAAGASFNLEVLVLRRLDFANTMVTRLAGPVVLSNNRNDRGAEAFNQDLTVQVSKLMEQRHNRGLAETLRALKVNSE